MNGFLDRCWANLASVLGNLMTFTLGRFASTSINKKNWAARNQRSIVFCAILTFTVAQELTPKSAKP